MELVAYKSTITPKTYRLNIAAHIISTTFSQVVK